MTLLNGNSNTFRCPLGTLPKGGQVSAGAEVSGRKSTAAAAFPQEVRDTVELAIGKTSERIQNSHARGRLNDTESAVAMEIVRELTEGLEYIGRGEAEVVSQSQTDDLGWRWIVQTPTNDQFELRTRAMQDQRGQARIGVRQVVDDGVPLDKEYRLDLRVDRSHRGAAVDMHFLKKSLNEKVHGRTAIGKSGNPNHHFSEGLSGRLCRPDVFAEVVHNFQNGTMAVLA